MSLKDLFKRKPAAVPAPKKSPGSGMQTAEPQLKSDQPLPSVNAKKAGNKIVKRTLLAFGGALVLYLLYYVNTAPSTAQAKAEKKDAETAQKNAISGSLPALSAPERPAPPSGIDKLAEAKPDPAPAKPHDEVVPPPASNNAPGGTTAAPAGAQVSGTSQAGASKSAIGVKADDKQAKKAPPAPSLVMTVESGESKESGAIAGTSGSGSGDGSTNLFANGGIANDGNGELAKTLQPTRTKAAQASMLGNRDFLLAKGAFLDCSLETEIDSTKPGMTSCILNRTVYSDNLKTVLLEAGSKITGQYQGAMRQGEARIFVLWTRIQTPNGVVIDLDSPGTSPLGASGHDGYVDTHFWQRFGGAIMLSMIQDLGAAAAGGNNSNTYQNTQAAGQNMATEALRNTINIPPTLYKNHGEHINIFVARDLSFGSVYALKGD